MFLGEFEHTLDNKGRLTLPSKFREELASGVVVTRSMDGCLWVYARSDWDALVEKLAKLPSITNARVKNFTRFTFSKASDSIPDRQGRILIPQGLRDYAGIENDAIIIGVNDRVEIWNSERWRAVEAEVEANPEEFAAQWEELGI